jgi:uncharacterized protein YejL (UPF0352 family)
VTCSAAVLTEMLAWLEAHPSLAEWALVVVGAITGFVIGWQAWEARRAVEAARDSVKEIQKQTNVLKDTAQRQLRAYVCVESAVVTFPQRAVPEALVSFKNCGQTPAYDVRGWIHTWFTTYPLQETLPDAPKELRKSVETLGPGRLSTFATARKPALPPEYLAILGTPKFTLYVYGEVRYKDIFGNERTTRCRLVHGGSEGVRKMSTKDGTERWALKPDAEGNDTT